MEHFKNNHLANIIKVAAFTSMHKLFGLAIAIAAPVQIIFGYKHHTNYIKYGQRTRASSVHIYLGRALFIALNVNVFMSV